jgi:hypothetical protein
VRLPLQSRKRRLQTRLQCTWPIFAFPSARRTARGTASARENDELSYNTAEPEPFGTQVGTGQLPWAHLGPRCVASNDRAIKRCGSPTSALCFGVTRGCEPISVREEARCARSGQPHARRARRRRRRCSRASPRRCRSERNPCLVSSRTLACDTIVRAAGATLRHDSLLSGHFSDADLGIIRGIWQTSK